MPESRKQQRGAIFVLTMVMLVLCSGLLTAMFLTALSDARASRVDTRVKTAFSCAESGVEFAATRLRTYAANFMPYPHGGTTTVNGVQVTWGITPALDKDGNQIIFNDLAGDDFRTLSKLYLVTANATFQGARATAQSYVSLDAIPIFQFFAFYNKDLEIQPGPEMHIRGRVHTNGSLYTNANNKLYYETGRIRAVGNFYRHRKDDTSYPGGSVYVGPDNVKVEQWMQTGWKGTYDGEASDFAKMALKRFEGQLMTGEHGVSSIEFPSVGNIDPYVPSASGDYSYNSGTGSWDHTPGSGTHAKGYYHSNAGMTIENGVVRLYGVDITAQLPAGTVKNTSFYDGRELKYITVTDVDVKKLSTADVTVNGAVMKAWPDNGLIYTHRTDCSKSQANGIRLHNAAELPTKTTFISPNPVYIRGDYNSTNKKGSAVISDAVNFLSNSWSDSRAPGTKPNASSTTYNLAMISGNYETKVGKYNGGLENLPRFNENWTGDNCNLKVSFVNIWESRYALGAWGGSYYSPPIRNWYFDEDFLDPDKLPPYTPNVFVVRTIAWWSTERTRIR